jgi:pyridoxal phosphate enzyme (YggS family)
MAIAEQIQNIRNRIRQAAENAGRAPDSVQLLAVSKTRSADELRQAIAAGQRCFGENYLQEALEKQARLADQQLVWHFIGPIQSNKTRDIAEHFDWVHSVERLKIARRLSEQRPAQLPPLNICLQVNISGEASKSGCLPEEALELARDIAQLPHLRLRGLMAIPAASDDPQQQAEAFAAMQALMQTLNQDGLELDTLSMGMSGDMEVAIAHGATLVRIGTDIFGPRNYAK